jgi:phosphoesterase RecJ-like protein
MSEANEPRMIDRAAASKRLSAAGRVLITTHARADGDAIGSALGLARVLKAAGKQASVFLHESVPGRYRFLPDTMAARVWPVPAALDDVRNTDLVAVVDTCARAQLGDAVDAVMSAPNRLAIDHHATRDAIVPEAWVDVSSASCTMMIAGLAQEAGWPIDRDAATLLFAGLATDTGWFRHSNTDAAALASAAALAKLGANPTELYERLFMGDPEARLRLIGEVLRSFELLANGRLAIYRLTREMLRRCGADETMAEDIINEPQRIGSVNVSVMLVEPEGDGPVRISLRSKHSVDVAAIARQFGGGGHTCAAGAKMRGGFDDVYKQVLTATLKAISAAPTS